MKSPFTFLVVTTLLFNINSADARDISPETIMISGDTSFDDNSIKMDMNNSTIRTDSTTLDLTGAYFIASNIGIGLIIGNADTSTHYDSSTTSSSTTMIGPMAIYSISLNPDFNIILSAGLYKISGDIDEGGGNSFDFDGDGVLIFGSISYFLNDNAAIYFGIRRTDADIDMKSKFLANPAVSATMSDNSNTIGLSFYF